MGCNSSPSHALMAQLAAQEPTPTVIHPEPKGMSGPQNTNRLAAILKRAAARHSTSAQREFLRVAGPFPLAGLAAWTNDWHAYRSCPFPHLHEGLDMFSPRGTPAVAVTNGVLDTKSQDPTSGLFVDLTDPHGTQYLYCHLEGYARNLRQGMHVHRGEVLGYVGNTGDASGGPTHLHFEVHPNGIPSPPKPFVDSWLLVAMQRARTLAGLKTLSSGGTSTRRSLGAAPAPRSAQPSVAQNWQPPAAVAGQPSSADATVPFDIVLALAAVAVVGGLVALGIGIRRRASRRSRSRQHVSVQSG
jgi:murein DD-endopeptidase MepM/ murein hydrolase activator NlpD